MPSNLTQNRYNQRGVSSDKSEVHKVVDKMDRGLFPGAFCKVTEDLLTKNPDFCIAQGRFGGADFGTGDALLFQHRVGSQGSDLRRFGWVEQV